MSIFKKLFKRPVKTDKSLTDLTHSIDSHTELTERVVKQIIDGKLYDTSKATKIGSVVVPEDEIPDSKLDFRTLYGQEVIIYKGTTKYFIRCCGYIQPVSEAWVRKWIGQQDIEKYIELFGEPELA